MELELSLHLISYIREEKRLLKNQRYHTIYKMMKWESLDRPWWDLQNAENNAFLVDGRGRFENLNTSLNFDFATYFVRANMNPVIYFYKQVFSWWRLLLMASDQKYIPYRDLQDKKQSEILKENFWLSSYLARIVSAFKCWISRTIESTSSKKEWMSSQLSTSGHSSQAL